MNAPSAADKRLHRHPPPEKNRLPARSGLEDAKVRYSPTGLGGPTSKTGATQDAASELLRIPLLRTWVNKLVGLAPLALGKEGPVEKEHVEADDQRDHHRSHRGGQAVVDQHPHKVTVAAEEQQGDEGEGDAEGEHHLAYYERAAGVDPYGEDRQRGEHGEEAGQEQRYPAVDEALHHHLAGHRPDRGAREA